MLLILAGEINEKESECFETSNSKENYYTSKKKN